MKQKLIKIIFIIFLAGSFSCDSLSAEELNRLAELSQKIQSLKQSQAILDKDIKQNQQESARITQEIYKLEAEIQQLNQKKTEQEILISSTLEVIADTSQRISELKEIGNKRLKAFYITSGKTGLPDQLSSGLRSVSRYMWYFQKIRNFELENARELSRLEANLKLQNQQLEISKSETEKAARDLIHARQEVSLKRQKLDRIINELKRKKTENSKLVSELRAESLRIEVAISSLSSDSENTDAQEAPEKVQVSEDKSELINQQPVNDIFAEKLLPPVEGLVVSKYGSKKYDTLGQKIASKGLGFASAEGSEVRSVAKGKVVFAGNLGDYGQVVIIDHGNRVHTLYSMLDDVRVSLGQEIERLSAIAKTSQIALPLPYNLYFELRIEGQAINPEEKLLLSR